MDRIPTAPPSRRSEGRRHVRAPLAVRARARGAPRRPAPGAATPSPSATPGHHADARAATASPSPTPLAQPDLPARASTTTRATPSAWPPNRPASCRSRPATTEIAFALGAGSRVIATTDFDDYPPEALGLAHVATFDSVDVEKIVGLKADLVIAGGNNFNKPTAIQRLRDLGVPVLTVYAKDVAGVLADIRLVGKAIGKERRGRRPGRVDARADRPDRGRHGVPVPSADVLRARRDQGHLRSGRRVVRRRDDQRSPAATRSRRARRPSSRSRSSGSSGADPEVIVLGDAAYGTTPDVVKARSGWATMTRRQGRRDPPGQRHRRHAARARASSRACATSPGPSIPTSCCRARAPSASPRPVRRRPLPSASAAS